MFIGDMAKTEVQDLPRRHVGQLTPPQNANNQTYGQRFKGRGNPNGVILGYQGDSYIDLSTGDEWNKLSEDSDGRPSMTGWYVEAAAHSIQDFDGADPTGLVASDSAFAAALLTIPAGETLNLQDGGTYLLDNLDIVRSDITIRGRATIKCRTSTSQWLKITGNNVRFEGGITFDGNNKAQQLLTAGDYSTWWYLHDVTFVNARVTDENDPGNTASTGSATAVGVRMRTGCHFFHFSYCTFKNISYDGTKPYLGGVGRAARGILSAPNIGGADIRAVTEADANIGCVIDHCRFIQETDWAKVDADAVVFQNVNTQSVLHNDVSISYCHCDGWGWRFAKLQVSGATASWNTIVSRTTGNVVSGTTMRAAIAGYGSNYDFSHNKIRGGSMEWPINVQSSAVHGRCSNVTVSHNFIDLDAALMVNSYMIYLASVEGATIDGNTILSGNRGVYLRGACDYCVVANNRSKGNVFAAVYVSVQTSSGDPWEGEAPRWVNVNGTIVQDSAAWGVNVSIDCENITVYGTQGVSVSSLTNYAAAVTGERGLNQGAANSPLVVSSGSKSVTFEAREDNANPFNFYGSSGSIWLRETTDQTLQWGYTSGNHILAGMTRIARRLTTRQTITPAAGIATVNFGFTGSETQQFAQAGAVTIAFAEVIAWAEVILEITGDGNTITWPTHVQVGPTAAPASIAAGKIGRFRLSALDTNPDNVRLEAILQP